MANLSCLLASTFLVLGFSPTYYRHLASIFLRMASPCFLLFLFSLYSVAEALFTLSFPFLSERFFFVHAKGAPTRIVKFNNIGVTGQFLQPKNDFEHVRGLCNSTYAFWTRPTYRPTDRPTNTYNWASKASTTLECSI